MNKIMQFLLIIACLWTSSQIYAVYENATSIEAEEEIPEAAYGHLDARALKALIEADVPFMLLDARGDKWHDGNKIPGAQLASYEYSPEELEKIIPHADLLIVVYCYTAKCPLADRLADKLVHLGYKNVLVYLGGLKEWRDLAHYPIELIECPKL